MRYQVQLVPEPPPAVTREEAEAAADAKEEAAMQALAPNAPLAHWLVFTRYGVPQARIDAAIASIRARPAFASEMAHEILHGENGSNRDALRALEHFSPPPTELAAGVAEFGRDIARRLRELESMRGSEEQLNQLGADISTRFSAWMVATRALQGHDDISFVPELQEILVLARKHERSYVLQIDVVRAASYYLQQWAGIEPLPTDPPPR